MKILITENQTELNGRGEDLITGLSILVKALKESGVPTGMICTAVETGLMTDKEMKDKVKEIKKKKAKLNKSLKDFLKKLEEEI